MTSRELSRCRECDRTIFWVETVAGAAMPLDPIPRPWEPAYEKPPNVVIETSGKARVLGRAELVDAAADPNVKLYLVHLGLVPVTAGRSRSSWTAVARRRPRSASASRLRRRSSTSSGTRRSDAREAVGLPGLQEAAAGRGRRPARPRPRAWPERVRVTVTPRRVCPSHQVQLVERGGRPFCPWRSGHWPESWLEDDPANPGRQITVKDAGSEATTVAEWRAGLRDQAPAKPAAAPAPAGPASAPPRPLERADSKPAAPPAPRKPTTVRGVPPAAGRRAEGGEDMSVPKCSKCGGNGHNRRTCSKGRAGSPANGSKPGRRAATEAATPAPSTALALGKAADLHQLREKLANDLEELDQAIVVFDLIEKTIPKQHVEAARALLVEAGLAKESVTGRHSIVLGKIVASVAAGLFAADGPRMGQKKVDALVAAADAIEAAQGR